MQEIRPDECVLLGVGHLIDAEFEWRAKLEANKVVGACFVEHHYLVLVA